MAALPDAIADANANASEVARLLRDLLVAAVRDTSAIGGAARGMALRNRVKRHIGREIAARLDVQTIREALGASRSSLYRASEREGASRAVGIGLGNYAITYTTRVGGLEIAPRVISIFADALSRVYGDANPALTSHIGGLGLVNGDTITGNLATTATATSGIGDYSIAQDSLDAGQNYQVAGFVGSHLSVTPRPLTITPTW